MTDPKILSQKIIFKSKYFEIEQITIERNGKKFTKEFSKRLPVINVIALSENDEIYLVSQYREAWRKQMLELVAGHCDDQEDPLEAAKRELAEETGLTAKKWQKLTTFDLSANVLQNIHVFVARDVRAGEQHLDDDEEIQVSKMPFHEAIKKALSGEISIASNVAAILLFDTMRREGKI